MTNLLASTFIALTLWITQTAPAVSEPVRLKVAAVHREPFVFLRNGNISDGFSIELWQEIAKRNRYNFDWQLEEKFPELLRKVEKAEVDLAIANISATDSNMKVSGRLEHEKSAMALSSRRFFG